MPHQGRTQQSAMPRPRRLCESVVSSPAPGLGVAAQSSLQPVRNRRTRRALIAASISCRAILSRPAGRLIMEEPRIRAATADDVSAITEIVDQAYRHYIA